MIGSVFEKLKKKMVNPIAKLMLGKNFTKLRLMRNKYRAQWRKYYNLRKLYPRTYKKYATAPVKPDKVVFIEVRLPEISNSFQLLYDELSNNYNVEIHTHFLRSTFVCYKEYVQRCTEMVKDVADAKYVFLNEASNVFSCLDLRPETVVTQTWHGCGAFKKFGMSTAEMIFGESLEQQRKYPFYKNLTNVTVSSAEVEWAYEEAMDLADQPGTIKSTGVSRTDIFYKSEVIEAAYEKLHVTMPSSKGKKVILYAPTFRGRVASATTPEELDVSMFEKEFGEEYVLLFKHHPIVEKLPVVEEQYSEFAMDMTSLMTIEELLCVSDICISDYSSLVFEYSLFERPLIFFAYDLEDYCDWRGFYYDYNALTPGPVVKTNEEMMDYIKNIEDQFDKQKIIDFKEKFMGACDGHATERILKLVFDDDYEKYCTKKIK